MGSVCGLSLWNTKTRSGGSNATTSEDELRLGWAVEEAPEPEKHCTRYRAQQLLQVGPGSRQHGVHFISDEPLQKQRPMRLSLFRRPIFGSTALQILRRFF